MFGQQLVGSLDRILKIILQVVWLNFLWVLFTLIGVVVAGVFPATAATMSVARKWVQKEEVVSVFQTFKQAYKREFAKANMIGFILSIMAVILYLNYVALVHLAAQIPIFVVIAYYFVLFLYGILVLWIFPLLTHYQSTIKQYFKNALIIGLRKMPTTITIGLSIFILLYMSLSLPTMLLFCTMSLICLVIAYLSINVFVKIDNDEAN
ncbi:Uncharacterized membrane protein YesL [Gracilibacillus orientalis]|uniref:Uncharacterized membrane protein YesL n=1 Tax=Gracilibacillus orientalis TaxID=334253 RepID=A0A1I4JME6_9BACI|nr:YesL family protein [Gracilibacillus orientalis]SFL67778.1 Uncharacterized membrane protein YesL [Gracilibacillus orientalis]